jgi:RNA polymerase sigma factor (sigma-70 family)
MPFSEQGRWFAEEVKPHEASLRSYLRHSLGPVTEVDDLTQECYARLLRERERGKVRSIRGFLFTVARNAVRDLLRRRSVVVATDVSENTPLPVLEEGPTLVESISRREELALLEEAICALPERCRSVFLLRKIQGLSQKEIATRLGVSENNVETLVVKGARRCAEYLRVHGVPPKPSHVR